MLIIQSSLKNKERGNQSSNEIFEYVVYM